MDPHEEGRLAGEEAGRRIQAKYDKLVAISLPAFKRVRRSSEPDDEQLKDVSPSRSSRIAEHVRTHKNQYLGGLAAAFTVASGGEIIRRIRGDKQ